MSKGSPYLKICPTWATVCYTDVRKRFWMFRFNSVESTHNLLLSPVNQYARRPCNPLAIPAFNGVGWVARCNQGRGEAVIRGGATGHRELGGVARV